MTDAGGVTGTGGVTGAGGGPLSVVSVSETGATTLASATTVLKSNYLNILVIQFTLMHIQLMTVHFPYLFIPTFLS